MFQNQSIIFGQDAKFTFSVKMDPYLTFILYKITGTQDHISLQPLHKPSRPFKALDSKKFKITRDQHNQDPSLDPNSETETIHLSIINADQNDAAYYLCIITNPTYVHRFSYGYLNVENIVQPIDINLKNVMIDFKLVALCLSILLSLSIVIVIFIYSCKVKVKNQDGQDRESNKKANIVNTNSIIEKTLTAMKNVRFC